MNWYKTAQGIEKSIKWECPVTGIYLVAHYLDDEPINYELYCADNSFVDTFGNFFHASNWAKKHLDPKCKISRSGAKIAKNNTKRIHKTAQHSSIMYYVKSLPEETIVTPNPDMALHDNETVPAFRLPFGKYFNPDSFSTRITNTLIEKLKDQGYLGLIEGDYMHVFNREDLQPIGEYDFLKRTIR